MYVSQHTRANLCFEIDNTKGAKLVLSLNTAEFTFIVSKRIPNEGNSEILHLVNKKYIFYL